MRSPPVIALVGQAGSGKTTVAKHLEIHHHYIRVRFAEILKRMLRELGLSENEIDGNLKEKPCSLLLGKTPRHAMQTLGTEWGRDLIHENLWANAWKVKVEEKLALGHKVVCDDCRFVNEVGFVRTFHGAEIWNIQRPQKDLPERMDHSSERELDNILPNRIFKNYTTIKDLQSHVDHAIT